MATIGQAYPLPADAGWQDTLGVSVPATISLMVPYANYYVSNLSGNGYFRFNFTGKKFRLIAQIGSSSVISAAAISIDGGASLSIRGNILSGANLAYEVTNLEDGEHTCNITFTSSGTTWAFYIHRVEVAVGETIKAYNTGLSYWQMRPKRVKTNMNNIVNIGDAISCEYVASSGVVGTFSNLGTAVKTLIPSASSPTPNGTFYWVYVDNNELGDKIFIADRNIQHSISWSTLNNAGFIFGKPINLGDNLYSYKIKSLSGGISTSDKENNWDQYIVNSDLNGVINPAGHNNQWNWQTGLGSWSADTLTSSTTKRSARGGTVAVTDFNDSTYSEAGSASIYRAFRPMMVVAIANLAPTIKNVNVTQTNVFEGETGSINVSFDAEDDQATGIKFQVTLNGSVYIPFDDYIFSMAHTFSFSILKQDLQNINNNISIMLSDSYEASTTYDLTIVKENKETYTFVRNFKYTDEYDITGDVDITQNGLMLDGIGEGFIVSKNTINSIAKSNMESITIQTQDADDVEIFIVISKDGRLTWDSYKNGSWIKVADFEFFDNAMNITELNSLTSTEFLNWFERDKLDFKIGIKSTNASTIKTVTSLTVVFSPNNAPLILNPLLLPDTIHDEYVTLTATLSDKEGENIYYQILINGVQKFPESGWFQVSEGHEVLKAYNAPYFNLGANTLVLKVKDDRGTESTYSGTVTITNLAPTVTLTNSDFDFYATIGDSEFDAVGYRILINGIQKYPSSGFTDFVITPYQAHFEWNSSDLLIGSNNLIEIEIKDSFGTTKKASITVFGKYKGLVFMDEAGDYYTDDRGNVLKYLNFGPIVSGQSSKIKRVFVKNFNTFQITQMTIEPNQNILSDGSQIKFSKTQSPFTDDNILYFNGVTDISQSREFYIRVKTGMGEQNKNMEFQITARAIQVE